LFSLQEEGNNVHLSWLQTDFLKKSPWSPEVNQTRRAGRIDSAFQ
jgi:hypothetical protein